jgi:sugar diacid utilization regulator
MSVDVVVGVGTRAPRLADARASYRNAVLATRVGEVVPMFRPVARFDELGVYAMLAGLPLQDLEHLVHPGIARLKTIDPDLPVTLELFLDRAGDTRAVADVLDLHRSTVYYRLKRIEEVTGADLANGEDRLALHLSLKIAKLTAREEASSSEDENVRAG